MENKLLKCLSFSLEKDGIKIFQIRKIPFGQLNKGKQEISWARKNNIWSEISDSGGFLPLPSSPSTSINLTKKTPEKCPFPPPPPPPAFGIPLEQKMAKKRKAESAKWRQICFAGKKLLSRKKYLQFRETVLIHTYSTFGKLIKTDNSLPEKLRKMLKNNTFFAFIGEF